MQCPLFYCFYMYTCMPPTLCCSNMYIHACSFLLYSSYMYTYVPPTLLFALPPPHTLYCSHMYMCIFSLDSAYLFISIRFGKSGSILTLVMYQLLLSLLWQNMKQSKQSRKEGFIGAHSLRGQPIMAGEGGGWSHWIHSREAERDEGYSSAWVLFIQLLTLAVEGATIFGVDLPTLVRVGREGEEGNRTELQEPAPTPRAQCSGNPLRCSRRFASSPQNSTFSSLCYTCYSTFWVASSGQATAWILLS